MSPKAFHVLVAAEQPELQTTLIGYLTAAGFQIDLVKNGSEAVETVRNGSYDLVMLAFSSSRQASIEVCRKLRNSAPRLGIMMIRPADAPEDEVLALDAGADDCIAAPFRFREVVARLGAILRRVQGNGHPSGKVLRAGEVELDTERRMMWRGGREVHLSPREFDLLLFFMENPEVTFTHVKLLRAVWGVGSTYDSGYLRSYVKALRRKIETDPARPEYILTEPWVGYRFHDPDPSF